MGVISKNDRKIGRFGSDSSESLNIPNLSEEDEDAGSGLSDVVPPPVNPRRPNRHRRRVHPVPISFGSPRRRLGKKRNRRYENVSQLETLVEDEELTEICISDFIPDTSRGFSSLFENEDAMQVWEDFVNTPEDQQEQIISKRKQARARDVQLQSGLVQTGEAAYRKISSGLRNKLKKCRVPLKFHGGWCSGLYGRYYPGIPCSECLQLSALIFEPHSSECQPPPHHKVDLAVQVLKGWYVNLDVDMCLGIVEPLESEVMDFFTKAPAGTYISGILTSFERLLLHAVAQYYGLIARSIDLVADNLRVVKISNPCAVFQKPCVMLVEFLDKKRNNPLVF